MLLVILVYQIHHHLDHHVLLLWAALGYHQGEGHEGAVSNALGAVLAVEDAIVVEEPEEQRGGDTLVAVAEGVVLGDEVEQHGGQHRGRQEDDPP